MIRHLRLILALVALFLTLGCNYYTYGPDYPGPARTAEEQQKYAVQITNLCNEKGKFRMGGGSGVLLDNTKVLTAAHVVACNGLSTLTVIQGSEIRVAHITKFDTSIDLAALKVTSAFKDIPPIAISNPVTSHTVCSVSTVPSKTRSCGLVVKYFDGRIRFEGWTMFGNSGSGIYNMRGYLIGITTHMNLSKEGHPLGGIGAVLVDAPEFIRYN